MTDTPNTSRTAWTPRRWLLGLLGVVSVAGILIALKPDRPDLLPVQVGSLTIRAEVVETPQAQQRGLSGRPSLERDQGMLFVFKRPDKYCIWMKDMRFDLDILWLDHNKRVVLIERNVSPSTYPHSFCPDQPARYVLEVNAGSSRRARVELGDRVTFRL